MEVFSRLQHDYFHDSPLLDYQSLRNLDLLNGWIVCINKLVKFVFFKKVLVRMFFMKKYFSAENVFIFQISLQVTVFFISIVLFFLRGGRSRKRRNFVERNCCVYGISIQSTPFVVQAIPQPSQVNPEVTFNGQWLTEKISDNIIISQKSDLVQKAQLRTIIQLMSMRFQN